MSVLHSTTSASAPSSTAPMRLPASFTSIALDAMDSATALVTLAYRSVDVSGATSSKSSLFNSSSTPSPPPRVRVPVASSVVVCASARVRPPRSSSSSLNSSRSAKNESASVAIAPVPSRASPCRRSSASLPLARVLYLYLEGWFPRVVRGHAPPIMTRR